MMGQENDLSASLCQCSRDGRANACRTTLLKDQFASSLTRHGVDPITNGDQDYFGVHHSLGSVLGPCEIGFDQVDAHQPRRKFEYRPRIRDGREAMNNAFCDDRKRHDAVILEYCIGSTGGLEP